MMCNECKFCFTNPYPDQTTIDFYYSKIYRQTVKSETTPETYSPESLERSKRTSYYLGILQNWSPSVTTYLDIGCGDGALAEAVSLAHPESIIYLVEKNTAFLQSAKSKSGGQGFVSLEAKELSTAKPKIVSMIHVLEHLVDPRSVLLKIRELADIDTLVFIDVPDAERYSSLSDIHFSHPSHFSSETLETMLKTCGFKILSIFKHAPPVLPKSILAVCQPADAESQSIDLHLNHKDYSSIIQKIDSPFKFVAHKMRHYNQ